MNEEDVVICCLRRKDESRNTVCRRVYVMSSLNTQLTKIHPGSLPSSTSLGRSDVVLSVVASKDPVLCAVRTRYVIFCVVGSKDAIICVVEEVTWC